LTAGDLARAAADGEDGIRLSEDLHPTYVPSEAAARHVAARALLERGDHEGAARVVDVPDAEARWGASPLHGWYLDARGRVALAAGRQAEAREALRGGGARGRAAGGPGAYCDWRGGAAAASHGVGDEAGAMARVAEAHELA